MAYTPKTWFDRAHEPVAMAIRAKDLNRIEGRLAEADATTVTLTGQQTLTQKTLTSPQIGGNLLDTAGENLLGLASAPTAVNYLQVSNAAQGVMPSITAQGGDPNVDINIIARGTASVKLRDANSIAFQAQGVAGAKNFPIVFPSVSGQPVRYGATGTDGNVSINITTLGNGAVLANGNPVSVKVAVPASATAAGKPGQWAADANYLYTYTGDGATHSWVWVKTSSTWPPA